MPELLYLNGETMPVAEGKVSIEDRGFQFADGVYEVVAVYDGVPYELSEHVERLFQSARGIELTIPHRPEEVEGIAGRLLAESGFKQCIIYIQVTRGAARRKHAFPVDARPTLLLYTREFTGHPAENYTQGIRTITVPDDRWGRCHIKSIASWPTFWRRNGPTGPGPTRPSITRPRASSTKAPVPTSSVSWGGR